MTTPSERRLAARKAAHFVAEIEANGIRLGCGVSRDASALGFLLLTRADLAPTTRVVLHLWVPGENAPRALEGSVVRIEAMRPGESMIWSYRIAVSLDRPPVDLERLIEALAKPAQGQS
jgi:PilZ domain